jgi:hypothetical protein
MTLGARGFLARKLGNQGPDRIGLDDTAAVAVVGPIHVHHRHLEALAFLEVAERLAEARKSECVTTR